MPTTVTTKPTMTLPTRVSEPTKFWIDQKFLMLGAGKIGKSEFWAEGKKTLFIETEAGLGHLSVMKMPCRSWADMREIFGLLYQAKAAATFPYDTIVVDTIDRLVAYAGEEAIARGKLKFQKTIADSIHSVGDIPNGAGWFWMGQMIEKGIGELEQLPAATVLIGHVNSKEIKEATRSINKDTISIGGQTGTKLLHWADHTLHIRSRLIGERLERIIRTIPSETLEAGSRGMRVPDMTKWGTDVAANYASFRKLFD